MRSKILFEAYLRHDISSNLDQRHGLERCHAYSEQMSLVIQTEPVEIFEAAPGLARKGAVKIRCRDLRALVERDVELVVACPIPIKGHRRESLDQTRRRPW